jgi:molybdate transport system ATP-binding protein
VVQEGPAAAVARRPATDYVARLVGLNLYAGRLSPGPAAGLVHLDGGGTLTAAGHEADAPDAHPRRGDRVLVAVSPTAIALHRTTPAGGSPRNVWPGVVENLELLTDRVRVSVEGQPPALVDVTPAAVAELGLVAGAPVWLTAKATEVTAYPHPAQPGPPKGR